MRKKLLRTMLLLFAILAGSLSAWADGGEVWVKTLPNDLKTGDKVVIVDLTAKVAMMNNPNRDSAPPAAPIKLNDRLDRITEETVGKNLKWTVTVQGSGYDQQLQFRNDSARYLNVINKDDGLRVGGNGVNTFNTIYDRGNHRAWFLHAMVNNTNRIVGMYSMMSVSNNWLSKSIIDDQIKGTVTAIFRQSDPNKNDVVLSFRNSNGEEDYNYETDLKNGADNFIAPLLVGLPSGGKVTYLSTNERVATVNASTGEVTLLHRGNTDITVVYQGDNNNNYALATYTLRVDDSNDLSGTSEHPFTVSEAIRYAMYGYGSADYNYYVKGIVCKVENSNNGAVSGISIPGMTDNSVEGTITYWLSDSGVLHDSLKVSTGRGLNRSDLTADSIGVGDEVLVVGPLSSMVMIDADNYMQTHVQKLVVEDIKLYLGSHRNVTELYRIEGDIPGMLGEPTVVVKDTTVAKISNDGRLVTRSTGKTQVTVSVPVTVADGTYTMSRSFNLKVTTTDAVEGHFVLVEDDSSLQDGDSLLIVATVNDKSYAISTDETIIGGMNAVEIRIGENGTIDEVPDDATTVTLRGIYYQCNLNTSGNFYFYTSAKKLGSSSFGVSNTNTLRHGSITGNNAQARIIINPKAQAYILFHNDSILRYTEDIDLGNFIGSGSGNSTTSFDPSASESLHISMPRFDVFAPDTLSEGLPKLYRFEPIVKAENYDYYVAELNTSDYTLTFKGTNTAPDNYLTWDATNTGSTPGWRSKRAYIKNVVFDETFAAARPTSCASWFDTFDNLRNISGLKNLNTSEVTTMRRMFGNYGNNLNNNTTLNLSSFNTSKVTNMEEMFYHSSVITIYAGIGWDISHVTNGDNMFTGCLRLTGQYGTTQSSGEDNGLARANFDKEDGLLCFNGLIIKDLDDETNDKKLRQYDGDVMNVYYDRVLSAIDNGDGTWTSKAYSTCLPYDLDLTELWDADKIQVCQLYYIKDNKEFMFSNCSPELEAGRGYLIIVKEGSLRLSANNVKLTNEAFVGDSVYAWGSEETQVVGRWTGTLKKMTNDECNELPTYSLDRGMFRLFRNDTEAYRNAWLTSFRGCFFATRPLGRNAYDIVFKQWVAGEDDDDPIVAFPSDTFDSDADFSGYGDETVGIIHIINNDGTHTYFDLQGRQLKSRPTKGIYISNGKKIIK